MTLLPLTWEFVIEHRDDRGGGVQYPPRSNSKYIAGIDRAIRGWRAVAGSCTVGFGRPVRIVAMVFLLNMRLRG